MAKGQKSSDIIQYDDLAQRRVLTIIRCLTLFLPITLAKRLVAMLLLSLNLSIAQVMELTDLSDRTVYDIRRKMAKHEPEELNNLIKIQPGSGRKCMLEGVADKIIEEVNSNNYVSYQQIADMVKDKFKIEASVWTIRRLLKKGGLSV